MATVNDGAGKGKTNARRPVRQISIQKYYEDGTPVGQRDPVMRRAEEHLAYEDALRELRQKREYNSLPDFTTLAYRQADEIYDEDRPPKEWSVDGLARKGHIVSFPSSRKTGKTTFLANLGYAGLTGEKFLGEFATYLPEDRYIVSVNAEMTMEDYNEIWDSLQPRDTEFEDSVLAGHVSLHCREKGIRINLLNDALVARFTQWLIDAEAGWLFLDPWKNFLAWAGVGLNDNDKVNQLFTNIQKIHADAGLSLTVIAMHTAQNAGEDDEGRAKGAGELEDGVDSMWRYVREGEQRFLSVRGRGGVGLASREILFHPANGSLSIGTERPEARRDALVQKAVDAVIFSGEDRLNSTQLQDAIGGRAANRMQAINAAVKAGLLVEDKEGRGRPTWYSLAPQGKTKIRG